MREAPVSQRLALFAPELDCILWRNNSGSLRDANGTPVRFGLGNDSAQLNKVWKSADRIGITSVVIQPKHVGRVFGIFTAVEAKRSDWGGIARTEHELAQARMLTDVIARGGIGLFATSTDDLKKAIEPWR